MHRITTLACLPALVWLTTRPGFTQTTGMIGGALRDVSGAVDPGAKAAATNEGANPTRAVEGDNAAPFVQSGVTLQSNTTLQVDVRASSEQVTASSTTSLMQANSMALAQAVEPGHVADLPPNGRNVLQLLSLDAGVSDRNVPESGANGFHSTAFEFLGNYELNAANFFSGDAAASAPRIGQVAVKLFFRRDES